MILPLLADALHHAGDMGFDWTFFTWALMLGALSAISLPLGSLLGLSSRPPTWLVGAMTAFGGGALIAALTVELVAPTALAVAEQGHHEGGHGDSVSHLLAVLGGMLVGGVLFYILDALVNEHGGFLRKTATTVSYFAKRRRHRAERVLQTLASSELMRTVPVEAIQRLVSLARPRLMMDGDVLFSQDDSADRVYFVESGGVALYLDGKPLKKLETGDIVGEISLLTGGRRSAEARASGATRLISLGREEFQSLCQDYPELDASCRRLASERLEELQEIRKGDRQEATRWLEQAKLALHEHAELPSDLELREAREQHSGAPLAIWLGILLDGIPESFVIGAGFMALLAGVQAEHGTLEHVTLGAVIPYTLIAGLFLSNFPEAMSSSIGMKAQGWGKTKILFMWTTLMVMTAIGAGIGYWLGGSADHSVVIGIEGLAAGAMLTMILSAMVPEAVHLGGAKIAGFAGLLGFLAAIAFKLLE